MKLRSFLALAFFPLLLFPVLSCASDGGTVFVAPDYSLAEVRKGEIDAIDALLSKENEDSYNPVMGLWRAKLLGDEETVGRAFAAVVSEFDSAVEKENWYAARSLFKALRVEEYPSLGSLSKTEEELDRLCALSVPGLGGGSSGVSKVSSLINGTVTIWVDKGISFHNGMGYADRVIGSGFFISKDGYIITNNHVIEDVVDPKNKKYSRVFIKLAEDSTTRIPAKVIGWDSILDLALLKAEVDAPFVFNLGSSKDLDVGDKIYAIGSPVGLERTLTSGIVSATDRKLFTLGSVMQIDAAVNSGNSGGPCIDENGNVQAIVFAGMLQYEGLNFAIPVEYLKSELPALFAGGRIDHPWISCFGRTKKVLGKEAGLEILYSLPGGSADRSGLKVGDVIVGADGQKIRTLEDFQGILLKNSAKTVIDISVIRGIDSDEPSEKKVAVYLGVRPSAPGLDIYNSDLIANAFVPLFGMKLVPLSENASRKFVVQSVLRGSIADESGFSEMDPLQIRSKKVSEDKTALYVEVYTKNRKKGYVDVPLAMISSFDSPYYF